MVSGVAMIRTLINLMNLLGIMSRPQAQWTPNESDVVQSMEELAEDISECEEHNE